MRDATMTKEAMAEEAITEEAITRPTGNTDVSMQRAINLALEHSLRDDPRTLVFGEDVGALGGVFRVTDGLQQKFGLERVFDTPLAESGIMGMAVGLAMAGFHPVPEIQFDGFSYPAINQIVTQMARMNYRSRGTLPMPITLRLPSYGGIKAPEHHGESLEALFAHVPGLKVVSPSTPNEAYHLLRQSIADPDPVIFMEPKSRYWQRGALALAESNTSSNTSSNLPSNLPIDLPSNLPIDLPIGASRVVREGKHATLIAWGAMVSTCLKVAEFAVEDGVELEVLDLRWLKPLDAAGIATSVNKTKRAIIVHEAPLAAGLGGEVSAIIMERCFDSLRAPVQRVTGFDVPYPGGALEDTYLPSIDRILTAVQSVLEYRRG